MTDKQIIIEGVDVSGCMYLQQEDGEHTCYAEEGSLCAVVTCQANYNCYYKQLKRKEQECERLKTCGNPSEIGLLSIENNQLKKELQAEKDWHKTVDEIDKKNSEYVNQLKKENEELKIYIESNEQQVKEVETLVMDNDRLTNEICKYKQALTEIKEIAENGKRFAERWMITGEQKANVLTYANAILQKISEVIDENN